MYSSTSPQSNEDIDDLNKKKGRSFRSYERVWLHAKRRAICSVDDAVEPKQEFILK